MKTLAELYYDISNRFLERSATAKTIGVRNNGTSPMFRKHYRAALEVALDLEGVVNASQQALGDPLFAKHLASLSVSVAQIKSLALTRIAANTITPNEWVA